MPRRRSVRRLERLCLENVAAHMQGLWAKDYAERYLDGEDERPFFRYLLGPFEQLAGSLVQELLQLMGGGRRLTRPMLHLLLVPHLTELSLRTCPHLVSTAIAQMIAVRCKNLSSLDLHGCSRIPSAVLVDLLEGLPTLTKLGLSETQCDTRVLSAVGGTCRRLRELAASNCKRLSAASLPHLAYDPSAGSFCCPCLQVLWLEGLEAGAGGRDLVGALAFLLLALPGLKSLSHRLAPEALSLLHARQLGGGAPLAPGFPSLEELAGGGGPAQEGSRVTLPLRRLGEVGEPLLPAVSAVCPDLEEVTVVLGDSSLSSGLGFRSWKTLTRLTLCCLGSRGLGELVLELEGLGAELQSLSLDGFSLEDEPTFHALLSRCRTLRTFSAALSPPVAWGAEEQQPALGEALQGGSGLRPLEFPRLRAFSLLFAPCGRSSSPPRAAVLQATLASLLRRSPRLEALALVCLPFSLDEVFAGALEPPTGAALRHLQRLSLSQSNVSPCTVRRLLSSDNQLSHIALGGCPDIHRRHHSELLRVVARQGLEVSITWD